MARVKPVPRKNLVAQARAHGDAFRRALGDPAPFARRVVRPTVYEPSVETITEALRTGCVSGVDPAHCLHRALASEAYRDEGRARIGDLDLVRSSPTLKIYRRRGTDDYLAGVRGTADGGDIIADAALAAGALRATERYGRDRALLEEFIASTPSARLGLAGHSLGGAVARELASEFGDHVRGGVTFNSAFDVSQLGGGSRGFVNYYTSSDPLYKLARPFVRDLRVVRADHLDPLEAHRLQSFVS
jgi:hypothetical protein